MPFFEKCDWDPSKNDATVKDQRKSFAEMEAIFLEPDISDAIIIEGRPDDKTGEHRFVLLHHLLTDGKPYRVVFAQRGALTRIISASRTDTQLVRKMANDVYTPKHNLARLNTKQNDNTIIAAAFVALARNAIKT